MYALCSDFFSFSKVGLMPCLGNCLSFNPLVPLRVEYKDNLSNMAIFRGKKHKRDSTLSRPIPFVLYRVAVATLAQEGCKLVD